MVLLKKNFVILPRKKLNDFEQESIKLSCYVSVQAKVHAGEELCDMCQFVIRELEAELKNVSTVSIHRLLNPLLNRMSC